MTHATAREGSTAAPSIAPQGERAPAAMRPRILAVTDMEGWAFGNIAAALTGALSDRFQIEIFPATRLCEMSPQSLRSYAAGFDAVYCFSPIMPEVVYDALSVCPMVVGVHSDCSMDHQPEMFVPERFERFTAIGCVNEKISARCRALGLGDRVFTTSNGIDPTVFTPPPAGRTNPIMRAGWCGAVHRKEGDIKRFMSVVVPACTTAGVPLVAATRELSHVPPDQMPEYYRLIDVYLCASSTEGSQGPLVEAAASGCALISTRVGIAEELINDGENGFLVEPTVDAFAERLFWCREHPDQVRAMGDAARQTVVDHWTWKRRAQVYAQLFEAALAG